MDRTDCVPVCLNFTTVNEKIYKFETKWRELFGRGQREERGGNHIIIFILKTINKKEKILHYRKIAKTQR